MHFKLFATLALGAAVLTPSNNALRLGQTNETADALVQAQTLSDEAQLVDKKWSDVIKAAELAQSLNNADNADNAGESGDGNILAQFGRKNKENPDVEELKDPTFWAKLVAMGGMLFKVVGPMLSGEQMEKFA